MATHSKKRAFEIICNACGKPFITGSGIKHHCSPECRILDTAKPFKNELGCWEWPNSRNPVSGYGQLMHSYNGKRELLTAHRVSYRAFKGPIPAGLLVCHTCDNRGCFNPAHLFLGTVLDNSEDMTSKGRAFKGPRTWPHWTTTRPECIPVGEKHYAAKLTDYEIRAIRASKETLAVMAVRYGVTQSTLSQIRRGRTWSHVL